MPDVFILGFTKCATTSLYNQLMQHEDVSHTKRKEPHYHFAQVKGTQFDGPADNDTVSQMFVTEEDKYHALYEPGKLSIDGSAMSIEAPEILDSINAQYPNAKYILMLRSPIERAFSAYSHLIRDARETRTFKDALEHELSGARDNYLPIWHNLKSSRFVEATQYARNLFGDRLNVIDYRDYAKNNEQVMNEVAQFLGLSPATWTQDFANRSGVPRSPTLQKVLMRKSFAKSAFVALFPEKFVTSLKRSLMERNTGDKPVLSEEDRTYFAELISDERDKIIPYMPDAQLLESLYSL